MVKRVIAAGMVVGLVVACSSSPRTPPRPIEQAPIGVVAAAPVATTSPEPAKVATTTDAPDPGCAVPTQCPITGGIGVFTIALERTACFGKCPTYRVTIDSRGSITWQGHDYVDQPGSTTVLGDAKKARELAEMILGSCFFDMKDEYRQPVTDHPWANTTVTIGNRTKTIRHYLGDEDSNGESVDGVCSAPTALTRIENKIDEVTNTARWIGKGGAKP